MMELHEHTLADFASMFRARTLTARRLVEHYLDRIARYDASLNSFISVTRKRAFADADFADQNFNNGVDLGPLQGVPYGLKDIFEVKGIPMTCNSLTQKGYISDHTAQMVSLLEQQGAVLLGKLNTHEFALGGPSFELPYPPARNPWNTDYFTGASSSGSGAAVAASLVPLAFGTDTSGSIRGPASYCGIVGFKPTYGLVSRHGVFPLSYSLDHCGPLARTAQDCAVALQATAGFDPKDESTVRKTMHFTSALNRPLSDMKVGVMRSYFDQGIGLDPSILASINAALSLFEQAGAQLLEVPDLPNFSRFNACGRTIMMSEAFAIHRKNMLEQPEKYARYTYQRISQGAFYSAADYVNAQRQRRLLSQTFDCIAARYDVLVGPGSLCAQPKLVDFPVDWPPPPNLTATQTIVSNVTGCPAASVPIGFTENGLPIGMQIIAGPFKDANVLGVCHQLQVLLRLNMTPPLLRMTIGTENIVQSRNRSNSGEFKSANVASGASASSVAGHSRSN